MAGSEAAGSTAEQQAIAAKRDSAPSSSPLAPEMHERACRRLAWVGLCYAIGYVLAFGYYWSQVFTHGARPPGIVGNVAAVLAVALGVVVFVRTKRGAPSPDRKCQAPSERRPQVAYANIALVFEVAAALGIAVSSWGWEQNLGSNLLSVGAALGIEDPSLQMRFLDRLTGENVRLFEFFGVSWVGVWIIFFPLLIPSPPRRTVLASLLSATAVPLVAAGSLLVNGIPDALRPWVGEYLGNMIVPTYICAVFAIIGSGVVYKLTHELSRARRMGSYQLSQKLGEGGMGEVWKARHRMLARPAAIKLIRPEALGARDGGVAETARIRFEREAQATAALKCAHTISVYDFGVTDEGRFYYVMELLDGIDLRTLVQKHGPIPPERAAFLLRQVCESLAEAHASGLIHRDIKPANIFACRQGLEVDFVKVLDFGLVKRTAEGRDPRSDLTAAGIATGTPSFMAPEMALGEGRVDGRADIYALGCVGYWLVSGQLVFEGSSPMAVILQHVKDPPPPLSSRTELPVPEAFESTILACLAKDPADRPRSVQELSRRLAEFEESSTDPWSRARAERWWTAHMPGLEPSAAVARSDPEPLVEIPRG